MNETQRLTSQIKGLAGEIGEHTRRLQTVRIACGKLLIKLRAQFGVESNTAGDFRGSHRGTFVQHLEKNGINVGSAYSWIRLAQGKPSSYDQVRNTVALQIGAIKKAKDQRGKITALRELVDYVVERYGVEATVSIEAPKVSKARA